MLPVTAPGIAFDKRGLCTQCLSHVPIPEVGEDSLRKILHEHCNPGGRWDCLVPLSGGSDSTYVAYQLVRKYDMRVLGYHFDNHFVAPIAQENLKSIRQHLGIEIVRESSVLGTRLKRLFVRLNLNKTPSHLLFAFCHGCPDSIWGGAWRVAHELRIPLVISGESSTEDAYYKKILLDRVRSSPREKARWAVKMPVNFVLRRCLTHLFQRRYRQPDSWRNPGRVNFFLYEKHDRNAILSTITRELEWKSPSGAYPWRFDCLLHPVIQNLTYRLLGMTEEDDLFSVMIREGQMDRDEALDLLERWRGSLGQQFPTMENTLKRLGLRHGERVQILRYCSEGVWKAPSRC